MGCPLPTVSGVFSDSAKLEWSDQDQTASRLKQLAVHSDDFANLTGWTETDADGKVNLSGGVVSMDGGNAYNHGIVFNTAITRAEGYFELKVLWDSDVGSPNWLIGPSSVNGLVTSYDMAGYWGLFLYGSNLYQDVNGAYPWWFSAPTVNTWYTIRHYVKQGASPGTWYSIKVTIQGGVYSSETTLIESEKSNSMNAAWPATMYYQITRYLSNAGSLARFKDFRWYSGYTTDGPYVTYAHDAGAGKLFDNLDFTVFAMPAGMASTNLKFDYYFGDSSGGALSGTWRTLAQLNAIGKITGRYRYIKIAVQSNSDGSTQVYAAKPNSDTATDGIGDFPATTAVAADDTVQGVAGGIALSSILVPRGTFDESTRNKFNTGTTVADLAVGKSVKLLNVDYEGTSDKIYSAADEEARNTDMAAAKVEKDYAYITRGVSRTGTLDTGLNVPDVVTVTSVTALGATSLRVNFAWAANAATIEIYQATTSGGTYSLVATKTSGNYFDDSGLSAETTYWYKARGVNASGNGEYGSAISGTTSAVKDILTACADIMADDIEAMTIAGGYNFDWGTCNQRDMVKKDIYPNAEISFPSEDNLDDRDGTNADAYTNDTTVEVVAYGSFTAEMTNPEFDINTYLNKMIDDLKKCFAIDSSLNGNCYSISYSSATREKTKDGDAIVAGKIITKWILSYAQDRINPTLLSS